MRLRFIAFFVAWAASLELMAASSDTELWADTLRADVTVLANHIGERNCYRPAKLEEAGAWIESRFAAIGFKSRRLPVNVPAGPPYDCGAMTVWNIEAEKIGTTRPDEIVVVGAHYDSKVAMDKWNAHGPPRKDRKGTPGGNDNASGVAATLALAEMLKDIPLERSVRFVAFVNEEPPFFQTDTMGSAVYAKGLVGDKTRRVVGMITPETLGCYSVQPTHHKRVKLAGAVGLPDKADYVAFLCNRTSYRFSRERAKVFRKASTVPVRVVAFPTISRGVAWSDDWAFWRQKVPAFAVTDTAYLRSDRYHELDDTADWLDYGTMADVVLGIKGAIVDLANSRP